MYYTACFIGCGYYGFALPSLLNHAYVIPHTSY
jgi:hypothetical protein